MWPGLVEWAKGAMLASDPPLASAANVVRARWQISCRFATAPRLDAPQ
jgi:hypothetical protein